MTEPAVKPCILLVDDDPRALLAMEGSLQSDDYDIVTARSGAEALKLLKEPLDFAFALLDVRMPVMDGFALAQAIKAQDKFAQLPLCFLTASRDERNEALHALKLGAVDFLTKPPEPELLRAKIPVYIDLWKNSRQLAAANLKLTSLNVALETERQKIKFSEERLRHIIDATPNGLLTVDQNGAITLVNTQMEVLFGYTQAQMLGQPIEMLLPERLRAAHPGHRLGYMKAPHTRPMGAGRNLFGRRKDGSEFPVEIGLSSLPTPEGLRVIASVVDISERKKLDQMKTEFISTVSHELRTPLTSINGALAMVCGGALGPVTEELKLMLDIALRNTKRLTALINDLLDIEKSAAGKMKFLLQEQSLMPLLEQALESMQAFAEKAGVRLLLAQRADGVRVTVDAKRLEQVIDNLLSNAIKFSPSGAQVELSVSAQDPKGPVRISVMDHGSGVPADFADRIFTKFSQADASDSRSHSGTGLGLAISKDLIEHMNGLIGYHSEPGAGATFYVELEQGQGQGRILLLQEDPELSTQLWLLLQNAGYSTTLASSAQEALWVLAQQPCDLVLLDYQLPDSRALDFLHQIEQMKNPIPAILISAVMEHNELAIDKHFPNVECLEKPVDPIRLLTLVQQCLNGVLNRAKILHIEDGQDLQTILATSLGASGVDFTGASTLGEARELLANQPYDLVILDIGMPDGSGWSLLPTLNALNPKPRVLVLSVNEWPAEQANSVDLTLVKSRVTNTELLASIRHEIQASKSHPLEVAHHDSEQNSLR